MSRPLTVVKQVPSLLLDVNCTLSLLTSSKAILKKTLCKSCKIASLNMGDHATSELTMLNFIVVLAGNSTFVNYGLVSSILNPIISIRILLNVFGNL